MGQATSNMGDPSADYTGVIAPYSIAGGIFDFSGTQAEMQYIFVDGGEKGGSAPTKAEIDELVRCWWDGSSDSWMTDKEFMASQSDIKLKIGGIEYRLMRRIPFGDNDSQHVILGRSKNKDHKTGIVIAHSDYTVAIAIYDEEELQTDGPLQMQMTNLMGAYKQSGFYTVGFASNI